MKINDLVAKGKKLPRMQHRVIELEIGERRTMEDKIKSSNICLIRVREGENRKKKGKAK